MSGAADALQPVGHALGRLELEHEIHRADVDPQLQRARADERAKLAGLKRLLEHEAALARQRSVIGKRDLLAGERVDPRRHLLGLRAVVDEDERRARVAHVLEHERRDRRPDRPPDVRRDLPPATRRTSRSA